MAVRFKIYYNRDSKVFYGGEDVTGFIEVKGPMTIPGAAVALGFKGMTKTLQQVRNRTMTDDQVLFQTVQQLYNGPIDVAKDSVQTFPFKLTLPEQTEPSWGAPKVKYSKKEPFVKGPHPIPPSCEMSGQYIRPWAAEVLYSLSGDVKGLPGKGLHIRHHTEGMITVVPSPAQTNLMLQGAPTENVAQSKQFTHSSSRLLEGKENERRSAKTWFGDKFSSGGPKAVFSITARTATTLVGGQGIPIQVTLDYDSAASNLPSIPEFRLVQLKYKLKATTQVISRGFLAPELPHREYSTVFKRQMKFAQMVLTNGQALDIGIIDTERGGVHYIPLEASLVTAFTTYNISRAYSAEIHIIYECGGKQMKAKFKWDTVNIVFSDEYHIKAGPPTVADPNGNLQGGAAAVSVLLGVLAVATALGG